MRPNWGAIIVLALCLAGAAAAILSGHKEAGLVIAMVGQVVQAVLPSLVQPSAPSPKT